MIATSLLDIGILGVLVYACLMRINLMYRGDSQVERAALIAVCIAAFAKFLFITQDVYNPPWHHLVMHAGMAVFMVRYAMRVERFRDRTRLGPH